MHEEEDELLEMIDHPTMRSSIQKGDVRDSLYRSKELEKKNAKLALLINESYVDKERNYNASQKYKNKYPEMDTKLYWSQENQKLAVDNYGDSIVPQITLDRDNLKTKIEKQKEEDERARIIREKQERQKKIEEEHTKLLKDNSIKRQLLLKQIQSSNEDSSVKSSGRKSNRFYNPGEANDSSEK